MSDNNIINTEKLHKSVINICEKFEYEIMQCINCPIILECRITKDKLNNLKEKAKEYSDAVYEEEIEMDESADNKLRAQNKRDYTYKKYLQDNAHKNLEHKRCEFEKKEILNSLQKFVEAGYDIEDPRVYLIVNELVSNILISGRANKAFTNLGVLMKRDTPGGPVYYNNPMLKIKTEFSKLIIEATEALDRILKSDESVKAEKDFTSHLFVALGLHDKKKKLAIKNVIDIEEDGKEEKIKY